MTGADEAGEIAALRQMVALQARVCYMNVDRTLATWTRTALALIVFGAVVDRYSLLLVRNHPPHVGTWLAPNPVSDLGGLVLIALGMFIAGTTAIRHEAYRIRWRRAYGHDPGFGPWSTFVFAVMVVGFGAALLAVLVVLVR